MKKFIKEYFNYTKSEKAGIVVLVSIISLVFMVALLIDKVNENKNYDFSEFEAQLSKVEPEPETKASTAPTDAIALFNFNPNTISQNNLIKLGLSSHQAQTFINYRKAGGVFKTPDDLLKIYSINNSLFEKLKPYVQIQNGEIKLENENTEAQQKIKTDNEVIKFEPIELNTADSIDLIKLPGIGNVYARRIIDYRNFLGGFYDKAQLLEVFGLSADTYKSISNLVTVDTAYIQKINLNTIEFKSLNKHPYISYANTKSILKYRQLMGSFSSINTIVQNHLIDTLTYNKIKHYISVN